MAHLATTPPSDPFHTRRIRLRTFGTFDAFMGAKPIAFSRTRAKELLAYLADRQGSGVTLADICSALFEDESGSKTSKKVRSEPHLKPEAGAGSRGRRGYPY